MSKRHPDIGRWADFARSLLGGARQETMRRHLDDGCGRCARRLQTVHRLLALARADQGTVVPRDAMRMAKSIAALASFGARPQGARLRDVLMERLFDSALEPASAGARRQATSQRQLVCQAADYTLDLRVEPRADSARSSVTGSLVQESGEPPGRVPACLMAGDGETSFFFTSDRGEFALAADLAEGGVLRFLVADDLRIAVEL